MLEGNHYKEILFNRSKKLEIVKNKIYDISLNRKLTNYREDIVLSLAHMFCNRLTGNREYEQKYLAILRHALFSIVQRNEKLNKEIQTKQG